MCGDADARKQSRPCIQPAWGAPLCCTRRPLRQRSTPPHLLRHDGALLVKPEPQQQSRLDAERLQGAGQGVRPALVCVCVCVGRAGGGQVGIRG
jgi:hypothetical protein